MEIELETNSVTCTVTEDMLEKSMGCGDTETYAIGMMVSLMERAAKQLGGEKFIETCADDAETQSSRVQFTFVRLNFCIHGSPLVFLLYIENCQLLIVTAFSIQLRETVRSYGPCGLFSSSDTVR